MALSGTSGGAVCALLAWYALLRGNREGSAELLDSFWRSASTDSPWQRLLNDWSVGTVRLADAAVLPAVSPYLYPPFAREELRRLLRAHVDFESLDDLVGPSSPVLFVGAVDVLSGEFQVFGSHEFRGGRKAVNPGDDGIGVEAILASAAIPTLFRAVHVGDGLYWDGLFSQNPPIRDLPAVNPDEIWVIRINPKRRAEEPRSMVDIVDRRNELSGNLSLSQEIFFVQKINELVEKGLLAESEYRSIEVRAVEMQKDLDYASKLDRDPAFIRELMNHGEQQAGEFLEKLDPGSV